MKSKTILAAGAFTVLTLAAAAGVMLAPKHASAIDDKAMAPAAKVDAKAGKTYAVDPVHASVVFKIKHLNASNFYGTLNDISGSFTTGATFSADVKVKADSVDSRNDKRDQHIKSPDFFSAKEFPEMTFSAKDLAASGTDGWKGTGQLTFRGVTKPVEVEIKKTGAGPGMQGGEVAGIETSFTFKRSDFGSKALIGPLSDEVTIIVALEGGAK